MVWNAASNYVRAASYDDTKAYASMGRQINGCAAGADHPCRTGIRFDNADKNARAFNDGRWRRSIHWYHLDMNYRGLTVMLVFCGCVGQAWWRLGATTSAVKNLRPQTGWQPLAFALTGSASGASLRTAPLLL
ncbi:hypothetical protein KCP70_25575 [Salmonella enterica subsp. enterica]|nr:hypothetical protein KCP70_25575 [Salmonella enterica subsp. enterica]